MPGTTQIRLGRNPAGKVGCKMGKGAGGSISDCVKPVVKKKERLLNCKKRDTQNRCLEWSLVKINFQICFPFTSPTKSRFSGSCSLENQTWVAEGKTISRLDIKCLISHSPEKSSTHAPGICSRSTILQAFYWVTWYNECERFSFLVRSSARILLIVLEMRGERKENVADLRSLQLKWGDARKNAISIFFFKLGWETARKNG